MTIHECLLFIKGLHDFTERSVSNKGPWCWPTRELLAGNVALNREFFGRNADADMRYQMAVARRRGWLVEGACQSHCHAQHVRLTGAGAEALRLMDELGCQHEKIRECVRSGFKLQRKAAA